MKHLDVTPKDDRWVLTVYDYDGAPLLHLSALREDVVPMMIEAATIHPDLHIEASLPWAAFNPERFAGVSLDFGIPNTIRASIKDGDTGAAIRGEGKSVIHALAAMLRATGFKSTLDQDQKLTMFTWMDEFKYGVRRLSDERLAAEMEVIRAPDRGAW